MGFDRTLGWSIRYFSGTGNTARAVQRIQESLAQAGLPVDSESLEDSAGSPEGVPGNLILAFPVYSWAPPALVVRWLKGLPVCRSTPRRQVGILAVDGGDGRFAGQQIRKIFQRKGWEVLSVDRAGYPENWRQMTRVPEPGASGPQLEAGDHQAQKFAQGLLAGGGTFYRPSRGHFFFDGFLPWGFPLIARRLLGKLWYADRDCDSCGRCRQVCPVGTILMTRRSSAKPFWKGTCENCSRCVNVCPQKAIVTSVSRALVINGLPFLGAWGGLTLWSQTGGPWLDAQVSGLGRTGLEVLVRLGIYTLAAYLVAGPFVRFILRPLQHLPGLRRFFAWTFNKGWNTYLAPGYHPRPPKKSLIK